MYLNLKIKRLFDVMFQGPDERNYSVCFAIYSVLMGCALIVATQFKFNYADEEIPLKSFKSQINKITNSKYAQFDHQRLENEEDEDSFDNDSLSKRKSSSNSISSANRKPAEMNDSVEESKRQKYKRLFKTCNNLKHMTFLFMVWFMGIGVGLVFTFLFWHLQDLGGTPALYGLLKLILAFIFAITKLSLYTIIKASLA
jgi:hypothetical protein